MLLSTSNSYVTYTDYTSYCDRIGKTPAVQEVVEPKLITATLAIDRIYSGRFIGRKTSPGQPLAWPRTPSSLRSIDLPDGFFSVDADGNYRDLSVTPEEVKEAVIELAFALSTGYSPYDQPEPTVTEETKKVDVLQTTRKYDGSFLKKDPVTYKLDIILRPVLLSSAAKVVFTA